MPHGRAETAAHSAVARMTTKSPQEITVRVRHGVLADLALRRTPIFFSSHLKIIAGCPAFRCLIRRFLRVRRPVRATVVNHVRMK